MADESYPTRLLRFWAPNRWAALWLLLFGLAPLFFFETFVHEGIHWLTGVLDGADPTLIPFAHYNTDFGRNLNGATMDGIGFVAAPQIVGLIILVALIAVFIFTSPPWRWLRTFLTWWYLGLALDLFANTYRALFGDPVAKSDWAKFAGQSGIGTARFLSWLIVIAIVSQLGWIRFSRWHENRPAASGPWDYRGVAVFLGVVSLIAVIASWTVDHSAIDRNWWFMLVWIWQLLSLAGYAGYLVWATRRRA